MAAPSRSPYDNQASAAVGPLLLRIRPHMTGPSFLITGRRGRIQSRTYRVAVLAILAATLTSPAFAGIGTARHFSGHTESRLMDFARPSAQTSIHVQYAPRTLSQCDMQHLRQLAAAGDPAAANALGDRYFHGNKGVKKNRREAVHWFRKAAHAGNAKGAFNLAFAYNFGEGISQNIPKAVYWWRQSAKDSHRH
ncbi:tetratricopeptide repeat protein [Acidithiobacillus sp.]|uniref:tetratricopeptide repeat protein n=1 Tax=Acidithiobacillus sp. TaxID=1872118 RepID=UPI00261E9C8A|nr:tetratricopeptide repeat protein [Acidithiobacillus sp.]